MWLFRRFNLIRRMWLIKKFIWINYIQLSLGNHFHSFIRFNSITFTVVRLRGATGTSPFAPTYRFWRSSETSLTALQRPITSIPDESQTRNLPRSSNHPKNDSYGPLNEFPTHSHLHCSNSYLETTWISIMRQHFGLRNGVLGVSIVPGLSLTIPPTPKCLKRFLYRFFIP